jgi:ATP-binding cassette subfamily B protein
MDKLPKNLASFFWYFIKKQWFMLLMIQLTAFAWSIDHTFWPYVIMLLIDTLNSISENRAEMWSALTVPIVAGIVLLIGVEFCYRLSGFLAAKTIPKLEAAIRMKMFNYVQHHSYTYFSDNFSGTIANKISDMPMSFNRILDLVMRLFLPTLLTVIISTMLFARLQPTFAYILLGWIFIQGIVSYLYSKKGARYTEIHAHARSKLSGKIVDSLSNYINVKLFSRYPYELQYLSKFQNDEVQKHQYSLWYLEVMMTVFGITSIVATGFIAYGYMLYSWQKEIITTGEVVFIFNSIWNINAMVWTAGRELPHLFREIGICKQALSIIQDRHDVVDVPDAKPLNVTQGKIEFDNVTFGHRKEVKLFEKLSLTLNPGEKVGLVGFSGSGKTTFVQLILRYFNIESGRIVIDGQDIAKVTQSSLREQIAMIPQDASLFHRKLRENILYGRLDATEEEMIEASKEAHCHEFIEKMPEGYDSPVGERGFKLSGGQRQRVAVARAILKKAPILIFDEATSALDSVTEKYIKEAVNELIEGKTAIVIAHRLSTLSDMDRILVFKSGNIIEEGSHQELLDAGGHYANLWQMQAGGFLPEDEDEEE